MGEGRYTARCERFANSVKCRAKFAAEEKPKNQHDRRAGRPSAGKRTSAEKHAATSVARAAKAMHTSEKKVSYAKRLQRDHPEKLAAVRAGKITLKEAFSVQCRATLHRSPSAAN
jgi:hypothetical protein